MPTNSQPSHIVFDLRAGHYVVTTDDGHRQRTTGDLVEAVAWADPEGTGVVKCCRITERHVAAFCDAPVEPQPASRICSVPKPIRAPAHKMTAESAAEFNRAFGTGGF